MAWISFSGVTLPKSALLSRFAYIEGGAYVQKVKGIPVFHMVGQRLFSGRVAVAQAALQFRRALFATTRAYTDGKQVWAPSSAKAMEARMAGDTAAFLARCLHT
jgi:acyl-CoA oxidase